MIASLDAVIHHTAALLGATTLSVVIVTCVKSTQAVSLDGAAAATFGTHAAPMMG